MVEKSAPQENKSPLDSLPAELKARLDALQSEVRLDKITTSFSIEERTQDGKRSTFYSVTASRGHGAEVTQFHGQDQPAAFTPEEAKLVRLLVSKHVVGATYDDAIRREILNTRQASIEMKRILGAYDDAIVRVLTRNGGGK